MSRDTVSESADSAFRREQSHIQEAQRIRGLLDLVLSDIDRLHAHHGELYVCCGGHKQIKSLNSGELEAVLLAHLLKRRNELVERFEAMYREEP